MVVVVPQMQQHQKRRDGSFVTMPSHRIILLCEQTLQRIADYRKRQHKKLIEDTRAEMIDNWWHKLWKKPDPTDEEVLTYIHRGGGDTIRLPETFWINIHGSTEEDVAHRLLNAAKYADEVCISTEDLERIS